MSDFFVFGVSSVRQAHNAKNALGILNTEMFHKQEVVSAASASKNHHHRKAKTLVITCLEFSLAVYILWQTVDSEVDVMHKSTTMLAVLVLSYTLVVALSVLFHSRGCFKKSEDSLTMPTYSEVEAAYAKTNNYPFIDGILEIPIVFRLGGCGGRFMALIVWTTLFVAIGCLVRQFIRHEEPVGTKTSAALASIQFYRITADLCEYYVYSRLVTPPSDDQEDDCTVAPSSSHTLNTESCQSCEKVLQEEGVEASGLTVAVKVARARQKLREALAVLEQYGEEFERIEL